MSHHTYFAAGSAPTFAARSRTTGEIVRRVAVYLRPYKWMAVANVGCAVLSLAFMLAYPQLIGLVIDRVIGGKQAALLAPVMFGLLGAFLLRDLFNSLRIRINNRFEQNVIYDLRRDVYARLQRLPVNYFDHRASGDLMTRVLEDVNAVERVLIDGTEQGTVALLSIVGVLAFMIHHNLMLVLVALALIQLLTACALGA